MHKNNFYNLIMCCFQVMLVKHGKTSFPKNRPQMSDLLHDVTEGPVRV